MAATLVVRSANLDERFLGSGFVYGDGFTVITNAHVVGRADEVVLVDHAGRRVTARVRAVDPARDLAVLQVATPFDVVLTAGAVPQVGEDVYAVGAPLEAVFSVTRGIVSTRMRQVDPQQPVRYLQHSAPVNPGSSGGPLVDAVGRVVGVNTRIADGSRYFVGIAYAVPMEEVDHLVEGGAKAAMSPGFRVRALSATIRAALGLEQAHGVLVDHVAAGKPAALAGLKAGDILVALAGTEITCPGDIAFALAALSQGQYEPDMVVIRDGVTMTLTLASPRSAQPIAPMAATAVLRKASYTLHEMGIQTDLAGAITKIGEDGIGFFSGLSVDDRILAVNGTAVDALEQGWADAIGFTTPVLLLIRLADGSTRHYVLNPWEEGDRLRPSSRANILDREVVIFD
ncbi:trypsin-like peptidase domain-containing protein [Shimia biformata]|uniref:trypsin-like peptidase domain-containing protein n=1 Tax=Shimia biformata TaxID=1294299 RepID=UPI0019522278|nr:trypsin-like peptidase domain-containing protein [Shimia biformata]